MIYLLIFLSKCTENILSTIRIIKINQDKKLIGAILNGFIAITWLYSTLTVLKGIGNSPLKIVSFILGCSIGSLIGSIIEEKKSINK